MHKDLLEKDLGKYLKVELDLVEGQVVASAKLDLVGLLDSGALKVKAKIPGQVDDMIIDLVINTLKDQLMKPDAPVAPSPAPEAPAEEVKP